MQNKAFLRILLIILSVTMLLSSCQGGNGANADATTDTQAIIETEALTTNAPEPVIVIPDYTNPLTGLACDEDFSTTRPLAIMLNNLWEALPQEGISGCDILYECLVEGGITRLMGVVADYDSLGVIGSVRSSRHYYLDLVKNHDAIYVHAGGSTYAYEEIKARGINNLDGVNMYVPGMFYRDEERLQTMKYEHTLMTTGEKIAAGIAYKKYRTELSEDYTMKDAFNFVTYGEELILTGDTADCVYLPYSKYQHVRLDYNAKNNTYLRYQFEDVAHIDGTTGAQLEFTNVLIIICPSKRIAGDTYGRIDITTEGEGEGYYLYGGKYIPIKWSKPTEDSPTTYYTVDGEELTVNRGKTFISIFPTSEAENIDFNYKPVAE